MTALVAVPDTTQLTAESTALVLDAQSLVITDAASYTAAIEFGKGVKSLQKKIAAFFAPMKRQTDEAHATVCNAEKREMTPTVTAEAIIKSKCLDWQREERRRQAVEVQRREEAARKLEEARRMEEALDLDADGDRKGAEELLAQPITTPAVAVPVSAAPKVAGVAMTKRWTFDPARTDLAAAICYIVGVPPGHVLAHPEFLRVLAIDATVTRQLITAMRDNFQLPGVHAYEAEGLSLGSK